MSRIWLNPIYSWLGAIWPLPSAFSEATSATAEETGRRNEQQVHVELHADVHAQLLIEE